MSGRAARRLGAHVSRFDYFVCGGMTTVVLLALLIWWARVYFGEDEQRGRDFMASFLGVFSQSTGYKSVLVQLSGESTVVSFRSIAGAIRSGALLEHEPVSVTRSDPPPPDSPSRRWFDA